MASSQNKSSRRRTRILTTPAGIKTLEDPTISFQRNFTPEKVSLNEIDDDQLIPRVRPVGFDFKSPLPESSSSSNQVDSFSNQLEVVEVVSSHESTVTNTVEEENPIEKDDPPEKLPSPKKDDFKKEDSGKDDSKKDDSKKYVVRVSKKLIDISKLNSLEKETLRSELTIRMKNLSNNPKLKITEEEYAPSVPLESLQIRYESYNEYGAIEREKEKYRLYLGFIWFFIQGILKKMNMPIEGYVEQQIRRVGFYDFILTPMAEKDYLEKQNENEKEEDLSSPWTKIIFQSLINAIVLLAINFFFSSLGSEKCKQLTSSVIDYLSGVTEGTPSTSSPSSSSSGGKGLLDNLDLGQLMNLASPFLSGLMNSSSSNKAAVADDYTLPYTN